MAHNGVCLTVVDLPGDGTYTVTAVQETLDRSNLGDLKVGDEVNLERSMLMNGLPKIFQGESDAPQASRRYAIAAPQRCCSTPIAFRQTLAHSSAMERLGEALCY